MDLNKTSKKIKKSELSITVLIIIGILIVVNFFSYQIFYRWDLTQGKAYSISKATKDALAGLDDVVSIKAYFSDNLPSQFLVVRQEVADILNEYENYSKGRAKTEFVNPGQDENMQRELYQKGIPQLTFEILEKDKSQLVNGYMGIAISYGGKSEVIPAVGRSTADLEYQLTTAVKKVVADKIATVGFLTSHGAASLENGISAAYKEIQKLYETLSVNLKDNESITGEVDTLVIAGPKEKFSESELKAIDLFLMRGGSLLVLLDGVVLEQGLSVRKNETDLDKLLEKYGVKISQDLAADTRSGVASFTQGFFSFSSNYPFWPKITKEGFDRENGAVSGLSSVILPWASSVLVDESKISPENFTYLAFTSESGWTQSDNFNVQPNAGLAPAGAPKRINLAVDVRGPIKSAYPEKDSLTSDQARLAAIGDSDFLYDNFIQNSPDNLSFFLNIVDSLSFGQDLISIRSKNVVSRPIKENLSDSARSGLRYANIFGLTVVVVAYGLIRYFLRRRSRFVDEL